MKKLKIFPKMFIQIFSVLGIIIILVHMDKIFDVKFDLNKENSNGLGLYIVSNILNNYNMEYKALQDEEFFIFKIKIFS